VLVKSVPQQRLLLNRMNVDRVVHTLNGAHFTFAGDYGRDESFQQFYVESAKEPETWEAFSERFLRVDEATYQREVAAWQAERAETKEDGK